jgi:hypothetical protein
MENELEKIRSVAQMFRDLIDRTDFEHDSHPKMKRFPEDCCHYGSYLSGLFLQDRELGIFTVIRGKSPRDQFKDHLWLQRNSIIIDITADQFEQRL